MRGWVVPPFVGGCLHAWVGGALMRGWVVPSCVGGALIRVWVDAWVGGALIRGWVDAAVGCNLFEGVRKKKKNQAATALMTLSKAS